MSKTLARLRSSAGVSKSNSSVASPAWFKTSATYRLRGLCLLLPLPCAKTTMPVGCSGMVRCPATVTGPADHFDLLIAQRRVGGGVDGGSLCKIAPGAIEQRDDLVVGGLGEVAVTLPDREEERRRLQAHHLVGVPGEPRDDVVRADRNRQHHLARPVRAGNLACRLGGGSGGDAVIDDHGDPPRQRDPVTAAAEAFRAASQFDPLLAFDRVHVVAVEVCLAHDGVVEHPHAVLADGAEGQFGLKRHTELAHHKDVERGPQCLGDLKGHRHAAARQAENDDVLAAERIQTLRQLASSVDTIVKQFHLPSVARCDGAPIWN